MLAETKGIFSKKIKITNEALTSKGHWQPSAVLRLFQEIAGDHVEYYGIGCQDLIKKDLLWVVIRTKYEICGEIKSGEEAVLKTWFNPPRHNMTLRAYQITDVGGQILVKGSALWLVIHAKSRQVDKGLEEILAGQVSCSDKIFEHRAVLLKDFDAQGEALNIVPTTVDIDFNGHVNNTHYADYMQAAVGERMSACRALQIDYHKECLSGESLRLFVQEEKDGFKVKGINSENELIFIGKGHERMVTK